MSSTMLRPLLRSVIGMVWREAAGTDNNNLIAVSGAKCALHDNGIASHLRDARSRKNPESYDDLFKSS